MVPFAGWEMPLSYEGLVAEHHRVRRQAGLFDLSHMGRIRLQGKDPMAFLQHLLTCDLASLTVGGCKYGLVCREDGGILDDVVVYRGGDYALLVVNASNRTKVLKWMEGHREPFALQSIEDLTESWAMLALQGPCAQEILQPLTGVGLPEVGYYTFAEGDFAGVRGMLSRTGYTGEDGFELYCPADRAVELWRSLLKMGESRGLAPIGLGARDTLRTEAAMALYGHEIDEQTNPVEAGLSWAVGFDKTDFIGKEAICRVRREKPPRRLVGLVVRDRRVPRPGCSILKGGMTVGRVTSGTYAPTLEANIAMGYVESSYAGVGERLEVEIRGQGYPSEVVKRPFYKRGSAKREGEHGASKAS
jgi:aminomethyltransferase